MENKDSIKKRYFFDEKKFEGRFNKNIFRTLYLVYQKHLSKIALLICIGFLGRLFILANANVVGFWVDSLCFESKNTTCKPVPAFLDGYDFSSYIYLLFFLSSVGIVFIFIYRVLISRLSARAISVFYDEMTYRASRYPVVFYDRTPAGRVLTRFSSDYGNVFRIFGGPMADFIAVIFDLLALFLLVAYNSLYYLPFFIAVFLVNLIIYKKNKNGIRFERRELSRLRSPSIAHFSESTSGAHVIRSYLKESVFFDRFQLLDNQYLDQKFKTIKKMLSYSLQVNLVFALFYLAILFGAFMLLNEGLVGVGSLAVALSFMILASNSFQMFFDWMTQIEEAFTGVERLDEYLRRPIEVNQKLPSMIQFETFHEKYSGEDEESILKKVFLSQSVSLEFKDVHFRYSLELPWVLKNTSFLIQPGERCGVVGKTGCGKSSLIQVLFKLYHLDQGSVFLNGVNSDQFDLNYYRSHFSYIPQDPMVFMGSVRENLTLGKNISDDKILEVLFGVGLKNWFNHQEQGLDSKIEERGRNISIGERQLICMARCILQNTPFVIMDEATSSVDPHSEELLLRSMDVYLSGKTQLIIAHRLSTLERCDRILWLKEGSVYKFGSTHEILAELGRDKSELSIQ